MVKIEATPIPGTDEHYDSCSIVVMTKPTQEIDFARRRQNGDETLESKEYHPPNSVPGDRVEFAFVDVCAAIDPSERTSGWPVVIHYYCPLSELVANVAEVDPELLVRGAIVQPLQLTVTPVTVTPFNSVPYLDQRLILKVVSPKEMAGKLLAVSVMNGWRGKTEIHGFDARLEATEGVIEFSVRKSKIGTNRSGTPSVNADNILLTDWPNKSLVPTPGNVSSGADTPSSGAAHL